MPDGAALRRAAVVGRGRRGRRGATACATRRPRCSRRPAVSSAGTLVADRAGPRAARFAGRPDRRPVAAARHRRADRRRAAPGDAVLRERRRAGRDVATTAGYRIQGTTKHRVKVSTTTGAWVWRRFADLQAGDRVPLALDQLVGDPQIVHAAAVARGALGRRAPRRARRVPSRPELAELVGYFMGDGSLHSQGHPSLRDRRRLRRRRAARSSSARSASDSQAHVAAEEGLHGGRVPLGAARRVVGGVRLREARTPRGSRREGLDARTYPMRCCTRTTVGSTGAFLRGLFEADGTVTIGDPALVDARRSASRTTSRALLLALGYPTTRKLDITGWGVAAGGAAAAEHVVPLALARRDRLHGRPQARSGRLRSEGRQAARQDHIPSPAALVDRLAPGNDRLRKVLLMEVGTRSRCRARARTRALRAHRTTPSSATSSGSSTTRSRRRSSATRS